MPNHDPARPDPDPARAPLEAERAVVRRATPADAAAVRELTRAAYARWVPVIGREPRPMAFDHDARVRDHLVDLLHVDGALAGLIETVPEDGVLLIENVAFLPAFQGRGLGRRLMAHAETLAASLGCRGCACIRTRSSPRTSGSTAGSAT